MPTWEDVMVAVEIAVRGRSGEADEALRACWETTGDGDAAQRCVIAHYLADQQNDVDDELTWDERALEAFHAIGDSDLEPIGLESAAGFAPSLHLNLGDVYLRVGRLQDARTQLQAAQASAQILATEGYGAMIRGGIDRLRTRIENS